MLKAVEEAEMSGGGGVMNDFDGGEEDGDEGAGGAGGAIEGSVGLLAAEMHPHCRQRLCCVHNNTYFLEDNKEAPCREYVATMEMIYTMQHATGGYGGASEKTGRIRRTFCLPFLPYNLRCFIQLRGGKNYLTLTERSVDLSCCDASQKFSLCSDDLKIPKVVMENLKGEHTILRAAVKHIH